MNKEIKLGGGAAPAEEDETSVPLVAAAATTPAEDDESGGGLDPSTFNPDAILTNATPEVESLIKNSQPFSESKS